MVDGWYGFFGYRMIKGIAVILLRQRVQYWIRWYGKLPGWYFREARLRILAVIALQA